MVKNDKSIKFFVAISAEILGIAGTASVAYARAGGGENYVSSDSGGSGGSYSSGSFGEGSLTSIVILVIVIAAIGYFLKKKGINWKNPGNMNMPPNQGSQTNNPLMNSNVQNDLRRGNVSGALFDAALGAAAGSILAGMGSPFGNMGTGGSSGVDIASELAKIKASDPQFNEQMFKDKVEAAFFKLQEGWQRQDTNIMRPFVSDSVLQRYASQLSSMKSRGEKDVMENIVIGHTDITDIKTDSGFNYITVKIDASAADYTVNYEGQVLHGSKTPKGFTEYWTFLRSIGVKTNLDKQLKDNKCPNCGAALQVNATGKCEYCGAVVTSGQFDWVVSEIRQM